MARSGGGTNSEHFMAKKHKRERGRSQEPIIPFEDKAPMM
jgi:hypothetical protein